MFERFDDLDDRPGRNPAGDADDQGVEVAFGEFFDRTLCLFPFGIIADRRCFDQLHAAFFELIRGGSASAVDEFARCVDLAESYEPGTDFPFFTDHNLPPNVGINNEFNF